MDWTRLLLARWQHDDLFAGRDAARGDLAGKAPEILVGANDHLHREAEVDHVAAGADVDVLDVVEEGWTVIPGHVLALVDDIVALERRNGDEGHVADGQLAGEGRIVVHDLVVDLLDRSRPGPSC